MVRWYELTFDVTVSNDSDYGAPAVVVGWSGSPAVTAASLPDSAGVAPLDPGDVATVALTAAIPLNALGIPRTTALTFTLDAAGAANDPDRANNTYTVTLSAADFRPDLAVDILAATPRMVSLGGSTTYDVTCVVRNTGLAHATTDANLEVRSNFGSAASVSVPALTVGDSATATLRVSAGVSKLLDTILTATIDVDAVVAESDETNNSDSVTVNDADTGWLDVPERLGIDRLIERVYPEVDRALAWEVLDVLITATDTCLMCDPWLRGADTMEIGPLPRAFLRSDAFRALVELRGADLVDAVTFQEALGEAWISFAAVR